MNIRDLQKRGRVEVPRVASSPDARTALERRVRKALLAIPDVQEGEAIFGDRDRSTAFFVDGKQMANFVGENSLALRLSRKKISEMRSDLKTDARVDLLRSGGDWTASISRRPPTFR